MRSDLRRGLLILWLFIRGAVVGVPLLAVLWQLDRGWHIEWPQELVIVRHGDRAWFVQSGWASGGTGCFASVAKPRDLKDFTGKVRELDRYNVEFVDSLLERLGDDETLWVNELGRIVPYASGYAIWNDNDLLIEDGGLVLFHYNREVTFFPTRPPLARRPLLASHSRRRWQHDLGRSPIALPMARPPPPSSRRMLQRLRL